MAKQPSRYVPEGLWFAMVVLKRQIRDKYEKTEKTGKLIEMLNALIASESWEDYDKLKAYIKEDKN